jgi:hypothetical protein
MTDLTLPAGDYTIYVDGSVRFSRRETAETVSGSVPGQFSTTDWTVEAIDSSSASLRIFSLPENNGQTIGYSEYRINEGDWTSLNAPYGWFVVPLGETDSHRFEIRAVNFSGAGVASETKTINLDVTVFIGTGDVVTGTTLTAEVIGTLGGETITYQWTDDGVNITGATSSTYTVVTDTDGVDDESLIGVTITVDGGDPISSDTRQLVYDPAVNTVVPQIEATSVGIGGVLTVNRGTWTGAVGGLFTETILRNGTSFIVGSTASHIIDINDIGAVFTTTVEYTNSGGTTQATGSNSITSSTTASVPDAFEDADWEFVNGVTAGTVEVIVIGVPFGNGADVTNIEYRINGGPPVSLNSSNTASYVIPNTTVGVEYDAEVRAINSVGAGPWSSVKSATPANVPDAFAAGNWTLTNLATGGDARIAISSLPDSNGAALTQIDYRIDGGDWEILTLAPSIGNFDLIGVFTDSVEADVEIRSINIVGESGTSDVKAVTTTTVTPTLSIVSAIFTVGQNEEGPSLDVAIEEENTTGPYTLFGATHATGTTLTKTNIENGTGDAEDTFSIDDETTVDELDGTAALVTSLPFGSRISLFARDSDDPVNESEVFQVVNIEVDADAPTISEVTVSDVRDVSADWVVVTDEAGGTVYVRVRPSGDAAWNAAQIQASPSGTASPATTDTPPPADTTAPTISAVSVNSVTSSGASWSVTSDEAGGTVFVRIRSSSASSWNAAQIQASPSDTVTPAVSG